MEAEAIAAPWEKPRPTCGNCAFSVADSGAFPDSVGFVICKRPSRGFSNHPIENQRFEAQRGGCIHHLPERVNNGKSDNAKR